MYIYQTMSNNFGYIDIILLAMIAGFIILRLRSILGKKTGHEEKIYSGYSEKFQDFKKQKTQSPPTILKDKLEGENKRQFLKGAELAYETILTAFAKGDQKKLKSLLTSDMASSFEEAIKQRQSNNIKSELTFIGIKETNLEKFERVRNNFFATVKFVSEIISVKRDKDKSYRGQSAIDKKVKQKEEADDPFERTGEKRAKGGLLQRPKRKNKK